MGRDTSDEAYVLDLCDRVLGEVGSRQHRFDWLLGDPGRTGRRVRLPVDGFWAAANLVVEYRERQHDQPIPHFDKPERLTVSGVHRGLQRALYDARRDEVIPQHGIRLVIITPTHLDATPRGRLRRNETHDLPVLRRILTDLYARSAAKPCVGVDKSGVAANDQAGPPSERSGGGRSRLRHRTVTTARPPTPWGQSLPIRAADASRLG